MMKRISAFLFDFIMRVMLIVGIAWMLSAIFNYDAKYNRLFEELPQQYMEEYNVPSITEDEYNLLSAEEKEAYLNLCDKARDALNSDPEVAKLNSLVISLSLMIMSLSVVTTYLVLEFIIPLLFKNGQTLGKKMFGIGVMRDDGVRINTKMLFVRSMLGKCTIEALIPIAVVLLMFLGSAGFIGPLTILLIGALELYLLIRTKTNSCIHDMLAYAVTVDMSSQMIFDSEAALMDYKNRIHKELADRSNY